MLLSCVIRDIFLILPHLLINYDVYSVKYLIFQLPIRPVDMGCWRPLVPVSLLWHLPSVEKGKETEAGVDGD